MGSVQGSALAPDGRLDLPPTGAGPLDGVRLAVKDLFDVAGAVTGAGNPTLAAGPAAAADASAIATLRDEGAVLVAKTATDELAMGMFGVNTHYGTPPNPAAPDRVPGGSSSGSASMVAACDADLGLGTDTGGSVRVPAAFCGLVGLRPTHGRIDAVGVRPMAPRFDTVGLLARDLSVVADALGTLAAPMSRRAVRAIVVLSDMVERCDPSVATQVEALAAAWADELGLELRHELLVVPPVPDDLLAVFWPLMSRQLWESNGTWLADAQPMLGEGIADRIRAAAQVDDAAIATAEVAVRNLRARLDNLLDDAIAVLPTAWAPPPRRDAPHGDLMVWRDRNLPLLVPASLTGAPQLTVPAGRATDGAGDAPIGISLLGRPGDDELLLDVAARVASSSPLGTAGTDG